MYRTRATCALVLGCCGSDGASGKGEDRSVQIEVELQFVQIRCFLQRNKNTIIALCHIHAFVSIFTGYLSQVLLKRKITLSCTFLSVLVSLELGGK